MDRRHQMMPRPRDPGMWQGRVAAGQIKIACAPFPSRRFGVYLRMAGRVVLPCV
ncbi:hypothetical protein GLUCOINTEAF2_0202348 [Komagataeibacter intermedius AF2]|uniref:Uncharacterized protein n=1 Tax=Komagataeibacter intermedius AF2 TaxID=1458464 RepID=A0A0N1FL57_9PROT|nr:hypothetical protein GLUCOINTEAF2_0202348 [Komagataeibacter intermedius AF2]